MSTATFVFRRHERFGEHGRQVRRPYVPRKNHLLRPRPCSCESHPEPPLRVAFPLRPGCHIGWHPAALFRIRRLIDGTQVPSRSVRHKIVSILAAASGFREDCGLFRAGPVLSFSHAPVAQTSGGQLPQGGSRSSDSLLGYGRTLCNVFALNGCNAGERETPDGVTVFLLFIAN